MFLLSVFWYYQSKTILCPSFKFRPCCAPETAKPRSLCWWLNLKRKVMVWCLDSRAVEGHVTNTTRRALRHPDRHIFLPCRQLFRFLAWRSKDFYSCLLCSSELSRQEWLKTLKDSFVHTEVLHKRSSRSQNNWTQFEFGFSKLKTCMNISYQIINLVKTSMWDKPNLCDF